MYIVESTNTMTFGEFKDAIERLYHKYFPKSLIWPVLSHGFGTMFYIDGFFADGKEEWANGYKENDAFNLSLSLQPYFKDKKEYTDIMPDMISIEKRASSFAIKPSADSHLYHSRAMVPFRKIKGSPKEVLSKLDTYFSRFHKAVVDSIKDGSFFPLDNESFFYGIKKPFDVRKKV